MNRWIVVSVVGRDRPGIVANVSRVLYQNHCTIEELSQMAIRGQFAMILIASLLKPEALEDLQGACEGLAGDLDLEIHLRKIDAEELAPYKGGETEPFVLTVWGEDRPGLVYGITEILAERGVNITNLGAKVASLYQKDEYLQVYEVDVPRGVDFALLHEKLRERGQQMGVSVDLQHRDVFRAINQI